MPVSQPSSDSQCSCLIPATRGRGCEQQQICHLRHRRHNDYGLQPTLSPSTNDNRRPLHSLRVLNRGPAKFHDNQCLAHHAQAVTATAFAETILVGMPSLSSLPVRAHTSAFNSS